MSQPEESSERIIDVFCLFVYLFVCFLQTRMEYHYYLQVSDKKRKKNTRMKRFCFCFVFFQFYFLPLWQK